MIPLFLQWASGGSGIYELLNVAEGMGFFEIILPVLLIFGLTYAILSEVKIFENNKGALVLVSLAVSVLSIQLGAVPAFFQTIFPKLGIGLSILLTGLILGGAFLDDDKHFKKVFFGLGGLIFLFVLLSSLNDWKFIGSNWWRQYGGIIVSLIIIVATVVLVIKYNDN